MHSVLKKHPYRNSLLALSFIFLFMATGISGFGQTEEETIQAKSREKKETVSIDTTHKKVHSPHLATIYSMVLPGLGQAYNKKYWKIPLVYAGFGVFYYLIRYNDKEYQAFSDAYYHSLTNEDNSEPPVNEYESLYDTQTLLNAKNDYRRNRDLNYILAALWYALNVVDATVDAHLFTWEVDDDLSLRVEPDLVKPDFSNYRQMGGGVKLTLRF
jgi:hypothetical protein